MKLTNLHSGIATLATLLGGVSAIPTAPTAATMPSNATAAMMPARPQRGEIGLKICRHNYAFFFEQWIAQVPAEWWEDRYSGDADLACLAWKRALTAQRMCGFRMTECWLIERPGESGEVGWLHMRATTCIGPNTDYFEAAYFQTFAVGGRSGRDVACHHGINPN
jgi:hypothetical protein